MISAPSTPGDVGRWLLALALSYTAVRVSIGLFRKSRFSLSAALVSDALLFAGSVLLLLGVWWPETLKAIGDPTPYLVLAGLAGIGVSIGSAIAEGSLPTRKADNDDRLNALLSDERVLELTEIVSAALMQDCVCGGLVTLLQSPSIIRKNHKRIVRFIWYLHIDNRHRFSHRDDAHPTLCHLKAPIPRAIL